MFGSGEDTLAHTPPSCRPGADAAAGCQMPRAPVSTDDGVDYSGMARTGNGVGMGRQHVGRATATRTWQRGQGGRHGGGRAHRRRRWLQRGRGQLQGLPPRRLHPRQAGHAIPTTAPSTPTRASSSSSGRRPRRPARARCGASSTRQGEEDARAAAVGLMGSSRFSRSPVRLVGDGRTVARGRRAPQQGQKTWRHCGRTSKPKRPTWIWYRGELRALAITELLQHPGMQDRRVRIVTGRTGDRMAAPSLAAIEAMGSVGRLRRRWNQSVAVAGARPSRPRVSRDHLIMRRSRSHERRQQQQQQQTIKSGPPDYLKNYVSGAAADAQNLLPGRRACGVPGSTVTGLSPETMQGWGGTAARATNGSPLTSARRRAGRPASSTAPARPTGNSGRACGVRCGRASTARSPAPGATAATATPRRCRAVSPKVSPPSRAAPGPGRGAGQPARQPGLHRPGAAPGRRHGPRPVRPGARQRQRQPLQRPAAALHQHGLVHEPALRLAVAPAVEHVADHQPGVGQQIAGGVLGGLGTLARAWNPFG